MTTFAYVRVSAKDQNADRQMASLEKWEIPKKNIYLDKRSGRDFQRPAWRRLLKRLTCGDLLIVTSIDRLGRNYQEIIEQWRLITKEIGTDIVVLDMPILDTRQGRDLTGALISDIVLQLLSYVAQRERENIRQRQAEGIAAAKAKGIRFGRDKIPLPENFFQLYEEWRSQHFNAAEFAHRCGVSRATLFNWLNRHRDLLP